MAVICLPMLLFISLFFPCLSSTKYEQMDTNLLKKGQDKLQEYESLAQYSPCWLKAMESLHTSCKSISDYTQSRLALSFANCHFEKSGRQTYPCSEKEDVKTCTSRERMGDSAFDIYTQFYTHSSHLCYYLQAHVWREKTEETINSLTHTSNQVVYKLEESLEYHKEMKLKQNMALDNQETLLTHQRGIASSLENTHLQMNAAFQEMYEKAESHKLLLNDIFGSLESGFSTIKWLLSFILGHVISIETAIFFTLSFGIIRFVLPVYGSSHVVLYSILIGYSFIVESGIRRCVFWLSSAENSMVNLHTGLWYSRLLIIIIICGVYVSRYVTYFDKDKEQLKLLQNIDRKLQQSFYKQEEEGEEEVVIDGYIDGPEEEDAPVINNNRELISEIYRRENQGGRIVSGTQLLDFLSGLYIEQNSIRYNENETSITTNSDDSTYYPPSTHPTTEHYTTDHYTTNSGHYMTHTSNYTEELSLRLTSSPIENNVQETIDVAIPPSPPTPLHFSSSLSRLPLHLTTNNNVRNNTNNKMNDSGVSCSPSNSSNYNLRPRRNRLT